jgi:uncharacterized protein (DUF1015 family)
MASIYPFRALMPAPEAAARVAAVPYDVVSRDEAAALASGNPVSFLLVSRPEIDLPPDADPHADGVYELARENFESLRQAAPLEQDDTATYYIYRLTDGEHTQTGIAAAVAVDDYDNDVVKKHERTRQDKEDDRTRHAFALSAHTGPVFLTYPAVEAVDAEVARVTDFTALFDFVAADGIRHEVWRADSVATVRLQAMFAKVPAVYVADGHHRAKSASRVRELCHDTVIVDDQHGYDRFLAVLFPSDQVRVLAYNRVVHDLNGLDAEEFRNRLAERFDIAPTAATIPEARGCFCMYVDGQWYAVSLRDKTSNLTGSPIAELDVSILQDNILAPILGIDDPRSSTKIDFVGGIRGTTALQDAVDSGRGAVAFSMFPVSVDELISIADAGEIMPPKSTWFEPKLRDGLLSYCF